MLTLSSFNKIFELLRIKKLLTQPKGFNGYFNRFFPQDLYDAESDPIEENVGSGGAVANLLVNCFRKEADQTNNLDFGEWIRSEKRAIIYTGGQCSRLPAHAPAGKVLTPTPVLKWEKGPKIAQTLPDLQSSLFEDVLSKSPKGLNTLVACGDVHIRAGVQIPILPEADVVCFGQWVHPGQAQHHGVFFCKRSNPQQLEFVLQKPSSEKIQQLLTDYLFLLDPGIWLLSEKAIKLLCAKSGWNEATLQFENGTASYYDLFNSFGSSFGIHPSETDDEINALTVAIVPMPKGAFYHSDKNGDLQDSTSRLQNQVTDHRETWHRKQKAQPVAFTQNELKRIDLNNKKSSVWIENSCIGKGWMINHHHILTGIPKNNWTIDLPAGVCLDMIPISDSSWCIRPYGFQDAFEGAVGNENTLWLGKPAKDNGFIRELLKHHLLDDATDIQFANIFPIIDQNTLEKGNFIQALLMGDADENLTLYLSSPRLSALDIQEKVNVDPHSVQRERFRCENLKTFDQSNKHTNFNQKVYPELNVLAGQIVWNRIPVRIDLSGGGPDSPPYSFLKRDKAINMTHELNGQTQPQVSIKPCRKYKITLRSIDMAECEEVVSYEQLLNNARGESAFAITKAALCLSGFHPDYTFGKFLSLTDQLKAFGAGIEISIPKSAPNGDGLETSSILASTVLDALSEFCSLGWDKDEINTRALVLKQMLTPEWSVGSIGRTTNNV